MLAHANIVRRVYEVSGRRRAPRSSLLWPPCLHLSNLHDCSDDLDCHPSSSPVAFIYSRVPQFREPIIWRITHERLWHLISSCTVVYLLWPTKDRRRCHCLHHLFVREGRTGGLDTVRQGSRLTRTFADGVLPETCSRHPGRRTGPARATNLSLVIVFCSSLGNQRTKQQHRIAARHAGDEWMRFGVRDPIIPCEMAALLFVEGA